MVYYSVVIKLRIFFLCVLWLLFSNLTFAQTKDFCAIHGRFPGSLSHHSHNYCSQDDLSCSPYNGKLSQADGSQGDKFSPDPNDDRKRVHRNSTAEAVVIIYCKGWSYEKQDGTCKQVKSKTFVSSGTLVIPNDPCHRRDFELIHGVAHTVVNPDGTGRKCHIRIGTPDGGMKNVKLRAFRRSISYSWRRGREYDKKTCKPLEVSNKVHAKDFVIFKATRRLTMCPPWEDCGDATKHIKIPNHRTLQIYSINEEGYESLKSGRHSEGIKFKYLATAGAKPRPSKKKNGDPIHEVVGVASEKDTPFGGYDPNCEIKRFWKNKKGEDRVVETGCDVNFGHSGGPLAVSYSYKDDQGEEFENIAVIGVTAFKKFKPSLSGVKLYTPQDIHKTQKISDRLCKKVKD